MIALCLLFLVAAGARLTEQERSFEHYLERYGKAYPASEYEFRKTIFQSRVALIEEHNQSGRSWTMGINQFTDLTEDELKAYRGYNKALRGLQSSAKRPQTTVDLSTLPTAVDWRAKGVVTPVKNQGGCGSCWAFSTAESVESAYAIATGRLLVLSPQNVVSCAPNPQHCGGAGGCNGATMEIGFQYVHDRGIALEANYPYIAQTGVCNYSIPSAVAVDGYVKLMENNYTDLLVGVAQGPVSVSVDASQWHLYADGVFDGCDDSEYVDLNHGVQVVGYGTDKTLGDYWIVRNSWGPSWGEGGFMRLKRYSDGSLTHCKADITPLDGSGCPGASAAILACGSCGIWYDSSFPFGAHAV